MSKKFITFGILIVVLVEIFVPTVVFGQARTPTPVDLTKPININPDAAVNQIPTTLPENGVPGGAAIGSKGSESACKSLVPNSLNPACLVETVFREVANFLMSLSALILVLCGWLFDLVVDFSIVKMATNIGDPRGVGGSITLAWATLRDIANMCFIFVLLFAAFRNMFDYSINNFGKTVRDIIIVALLINFSLFFSKVVIDASNIVAVGFYNSIATQSITLPTPIGTIKGISPGYMRMLGMQTIYGSKVLDGINGSIPILTFGILSAVLMLALAVILLIAGIMFAARFIILVFLMILSPLALIAYIIPGQTNQFTKWREALVNQSFFAPLYFALTWVVFKLGDSLITAIGKGGELSQISTNPASTMALIVNYVLIMGFSIAALIFAKMMASKTAGFSQITGGIGTAAMGGAGLIGRNTIGRGSRAILNSETVRNAASSGKWYSGAARASLWTSKKGAEGSFDVRGVAETKLGKTIGAGDVIGIAGKTSGKGGFSASVEAKEKAKAKYAKEVYGQTAGEKEKKESYEDATAKHEAAVESEKKEVTDNEKKTKEEKEKAEKELETKNKEAEQADKDRMAGKAGVTIETVFEAHEKAKQAEEELRKKIEAHDLAIIKKKTVVEDKNYSEAVQLLKKEADFRTAEWNKVKSDSTKRQRDYAERLEGGLTGWMAGNKAAARAVRTQARGKTKAERIADLVREQQADLDKASGTAAATTVPPAGETPPATPTT